MLFFGTFNQPGNAHGAFAGHSFKVPRSAQQDGLEASFRVKAIFKTRQKWLLFGLFKAYHKKN